MKYNSLSKQPKNEAKYEILVVGLSTANTLGPEEVEVKDVSEVVVNQILGKYARKC